MSGKTITINSISGGASSAYLAKHYPADYELFALVCINDERCKPKDRSLVQYVNAKLEKYVPQYGEFVASAERDETLVAMRDLEQFLGREIVWTRGMSFDDVIDTGTQTRLPSWARRYCTEKMKLLAIFMWWFHNIGEKCKMRIGFRADEFDRMIRFFNNSDPVNFSIPIACSTRGKRQQRHQEFNWRFCEMPLVKDGVDKTDVDSYWKGKTVGGNIFEPIKNIVFPDDSNCCGCFHKKEEQLILNAIDHPNHMNWFSEQEMKDMGTWLDSRVTYASLIERANAMSYEDVVFLRKQLHKMGGDTCDTGGCTN